MSREEIKIAIVVSRFNISVTERLLAGTVERLSEKGVNPENMRVEWVPGAVEIPLLAQQFAKQADYQAVIGLGAVIRGETPHFEYVCQQVALGCQQVALQYDTPIIFGVLTTENAAQAYERLGGAHGHKGHDAADTALEMIACLNKISTE